MTSDAIVITVAAGRGASPDREALDAATTELAQEFRHVRGVRATAVESPAPAGARSGMLMTVGALGLAGVTGGTAKAVVDCIAAWLNASRRAGPETTITIAGPNGASVTLKRGAMSVDDIEQAVAAIRRALGATDGAKPPVQP